MNIAVNLDPKSGLLQIVWGAMSQQLAPKDALALAAAICLVLSQNSAILPGAAPTISVPVPT